MLTETIADIRQAEYRAMTEKQFMAQIIQVARMNGFLVYHTFDSRRSAAGFPDLVLVKPRVAVGPVKGRIIFAEVKKEKGKLTKAQEDWWRALAIAKAEYYIWRPSGWNQILKTLGEEAKP